MSGSYRCSCRLRRFPELSPPLTRSPIMEVWLGRSGHQGSGDGIAGESDPVSWDPGRMPMVRRARWLDPLVGLHGRVGKTGQVLGKSFFGEDVNLRSEAS